MLLFAVALVLTDGKPDLALRTREPAITPTFGGRHHFHTMSRCLPSSPVDFFPRGCLQGLYFDQPSRWPVAIGIVLIRRPEARKSQRLAFYIPPVVPGDVESDELSRVGSRNADTASYKGSGAELRA